MIQCSRLLFNQRRAISRKYEDHCTRILDKLSKELSSVPQPGELPSSSSSPLQWTPDLDRRLLQHLEQSTISSLSKLSRQCGLAVDASPKKFTMIPQLYQRIHMAHRCFSDSNEESGEFVFIDVGVKNMAWTVVDMRRRHIKQLGLQSLFSAINDGDSVDSSELSMEKKNMPADFALQVSRFVRDLQSSVSPQATYIIEQQMQRHNPRCLIVEAQLHAFLLPNTLSISPVTVSRSLGISSASNSKSKSEESSALLEWKGPLKRDQKKRLSIRLVERILNLDSINGSDEMMTMSSDAAAKLTEMRRDGQKLDDICDCILNSLAFHLWLLRLHRQLMLRWRN